MRSGHLLFSAIQFLFTTLILLIGAFFIGMDYAPQVRLAIGQFFFYHSSFVPIGLCIFGCGILLFIGFYAMNRGSYTRLVIEASHSEIETTLLRSCVKKYWIDRFPGAALTADVLLHPNQKVEISLEMPSVAMPDPEHFFQTVESDLRTLFSQTFGHKGELLLTVLCKK
jgi:hypothetical protein